MKEDEDRSPEAPALFPLFCLYRLNEEGDVPLFKHREAEIRHPGVVKQLPVHAVEVDIVADRRGCVQCL